MTKRKIVLLGVLAFLCVVFAVQTALSLRESVRTLSFEQSPDAISVTLPGGEAFSLTRRVLPDGATGADGATGSDVATGTDVADGAGWQIDGKNYGADASAVSAMLRALNPVRLLGNVSSQTDGTRFGLDAANAIHVSVSAQGRELCALKIGNAAPTGLQTYAVVGSERGVQLVSGDIRSVFDKTADEIRDREIFSLDRATVSKITVQNRHGSFSLEKSGEPPVWNFAADAGTVASLQQFSADPEKTSAWVSSVLNLIALSFEENAGVPSRPADGTVVFSTSGGDVTLSLYAPETPESGASADSGASAAGATYLAVSSASPWVFRLSSFTAERYLKNPADFAL